MHPDKKIDPVRNLPGSNMLKLEELLYFIKLAPKKNPWSFWADNTYANF